MAAYVIDFTPLARALARLEEGLALARADPASDIIRDGVIQRFEFTYELSWKMLKRHLERVTADTGQADAMTFFQLIRAGSERGLVRSDVHEWKRFRDARGITSHVYDPDKALEVFAVIPDFAEEVRYLLERLSEAGEIETLRSSAEPSYTVGAGTGEIQLTPGQREIVLEILARVLPGREVWAFGSRVVCSRVDQRPKRFSDLDLAVPGDTRLTLGETSSLNSEFDESDLPFRVDIVDLAGVDERFRSGVEARHAVLVSGPEIAAPRAAIVSAPDLTASTRDSVRDLAAHPVGRLDESADLSTLAPPDRLIYDCE